MDRTFIAQGFLGFGLLISLSLLFPQRGNATSMASPAPTASADEPSQHPRIPVSHQHNSNRAQMMHRVQRDTIEAQTRVRQHDQSDETVGI